MKRPVVLMIAFTLCAFALALPLLAQDAPPPEQPAPTAPAENGGLDAVTAVAPIPTRMPRGVPAQSVTERGLTVDLYFESLPQGQTRLVHVYGLPLESVRATLFDEAIDFFAVPGDGYYALLSAGMEQAPRNGYELTIFAATSAETETTITLPINVILGGFITQDVIVPPDRGHLLDPEVERAELARLDSIFAARTLERMWDETGFEMPIYNALTSSFGAFRTFNGTINTRHTGWDIRCTIGTPVMASAGGRVAFAGTLDIRGQHVVIDHGYGVFSGYSHLSQVHVTRGQRIEKGQIIGMAGNTGRTSGAHFHWEMAVNGDWVDSVRFLEMWMP